jgi:acylphosphatase
MPTANHARLHATVSGTVQGVGFRYSTLDMARRLGLTGWVRNLPDGGVEVVAEGERPALERLRDYLNRGPTGARVSRVDASWATATDEFKTFAVRG